MSVGRGGITLYGSDDLGHFTFCKVVYVSMAWQAASTQLENINKLQ